MSAPESIVGSHARSRTASNRVESEVIARSGSTTRTLVTQRMLELIAACVGGALVVVYASRGTVPLLFGVLVSAICALAIIAIRQHTMMLVERARGDMDSALAVVLDLVNVLLAGGAGVETALVTAVSVGDGWSFEQLRTAIARAQRSREPYWLALDELGDRSGIQSLRSVAQSLRIATEHGGRIRQSLESRADALRAGNLARLEHEAERRTERMGVPMVLMFISFVLFIGYPAFASTLVAL